MKQSKLSIVLGIIMFLLLIMSFIFLRLNNTFKIVGLFLIILVFIVGFILLKIDRNM